MQDPKWFADKITDTMETALMEAVDLSGDRRNLFWTSQSLELSPFTVMAVLIRLGLFKVEGRRVTIWDYQRHDYVPYTFRASTSWWATSWGCIVDWLEACVTKEDEETA